MQNKLSLKLFQAVFSLVFLFLTTSIDAGQTAVNADSLPVRKVILYKHGVGYIERYGMVTNTAEINLRFKPANMSDMLKSLTVLDLDGGRINSVSYDSTRTVEQRLQEYSFDLRSAKSLPAVLAQLTGSSVTLNVEGRPHKGRLLNIGTRREYQTDIQFYLSLLSEEGSIAEYKLENLLEIKLNDPKLQASLQECLAVLSESHRTEQKQVVLHCDGQGERRLFAAYIQEEPVWKVSYRLVLSDDRPLLQAWAIVDNTGMDDWENVELTLVSGLPVSFKQNLYDPFFVRRPEIVLQDEMPLAKPTDFKGKIAAPMSAMAPNKERARLQAVSGARAYSDSLGQDERQAIVRGLAGGKMDLESADVSAAMPTPDLLENMSKQAVAATASQDLGALFVYKMETPVTIKRDSSALLPIANSRVEVERLSVYNQSVRETNPMDAVRLLNPTDLTLEGGALTVFEDNTYVGEALLGTLKPQEKAYVSFAVDLGTRLDTKQLKDKEQAVHSVKIMHGNMVTFYRQQRTRQYAARNLEDREKTLIIEHPRRLGWELSDTLQPLETTDEVYRFSLTLPGRQEASLDVIEELPSETTYDLNNLTSEDISLFLSQKYIDQAAQAFMESLIALKAEVQDLQKQIAGLTAEKEAIFKNHERLRGNLYPLGSSESERGYRTRIVQQMEKEEDRLGEINEELARRDGELGAKQAEFDGRLAGYVFEVQL